jgi:hypothetical protein
VYGTKWVYEADDEDVDLNLVISKVRRTDDRTEITVDRLIGGEPTEYRKVVVFADGLVETELLGQKLDPPWVVLKVPYKSGDRWTNCDSKEFDIKSSVKTIWGVEQVKVPAGTFDAVRVDSEYTLADQKMEGRRWYAPNVGLVKWTGGGAGTRVLKSFTLGTD